MKLLLLAGLVYRALGITCAAWSSNADKQTAGYLCTSTCASATTAVVTADLVCNVAGGYCPDSTGPVMSDCGTANQKYTFAGCATSGSQTTGAGCKAASDSANTCVGTTQKKKCLEAITNKFYIATSGAATACPLPANAVANSQTCTKTSGTATENKLGTIFADATCSAGFWKTDATATAAAICTACANQAGCTTAGNVANTCSTGTGGTGATSENRFKQCTAAADGFFIVGTTTAKLATACDKPAGASTVTCSAAGATNSLITGCLDTHVYTAKVVLVTAVTRACATTCTAETTACKKGVTGVTAAAATCTACTGDQTGCVATKSNTKCAWPVGKAANKAFQCTQVSDGYSLSTAKVVTKCADATGATKTWKAQATAGTDATCTKTACNAGWTFATAACTANACKKAAVPAMYTATGIPLATAVTAVTGDAAACPAVVAKTGVTAVLAAGVILAKDATKVADLGTYACKSPNTGTAVVTCPTAAGDFTWAGCKAPAAPAAVAQTMIGFVLTIIAMYL